jgi:hypothetical protein
MRCKACGSELTLTNIVPDQTVGSSPMPIEAAPRIKRASMMEDEPLAASGLLSRVVARLSSRDSRFGRHRKQRYF